MKISEQELAHVCGGAFDAAKSDGCTLSPDGWWGSACVTHDSKYYAGGSPADRRRADQELRDNMIKAGAPPAVANVYYGAVRLNGTVGPWKWGFGRDQ